MTYHSRPLAARKLIEPVHLLRLRPHSPPTPLFPTHPPPSQLHRAREGSCTRISLELISTSSRPRCPRRKDNSRNSSAWSRKIATGEMGLRGAKAPPPAAPPEPPQSSPRQWSHAFHFLGLAVSSTDALHRFTPSDRGRRWAESSCCHSLVCEYAL